MDTVFFILTFIFLSASAYTSVDMPKDSTNLNDQFFEYDDSDMETEAETEKTTEAETTEEIETTEDLTARKLELMQQLYKKAPEYEHTAIGFYEDGFSDSGMVRDGYVPYEEDYTQEDLYSLYGYAHGIGVRLHMKQIDSASEANTILVGEFKEKLLARGIDSFAVEGTTNANNDTTVLTNGAYSDEEGKNIDVYLYSDIRDGGKAYMCAEIEVNTSAFDEYSQELLKEVDDVFACNISSFYTE